MTEAQALTLNKKPQTAADFENNAKFYHAAAIKATEVYNTALADFQRATELEGVGTGVTVTFNEGKGEAAQLLTGSVLAKLDDGKFQILVQFVGAPAKLLNVRPADLVAIVRPQAEPVAPVEDEVPEVQAS